MFSRHDRIDSALLALALFSAVFLIPSGAFAQTCTVDAECNDGDPCTADTCVDNVCVSTPTNGCLGCSTGSSANCQPFGEADVNVLMSELEIRPNGVVLADDFVPETTEINSICVWGTYLDPTGVNHNCGDSVFDTFRVVIFGDAGGLPNPADLIASVRTRASADSPGVVRSALPGTGFENQFGVQMYAYTLNFDTIILPGAGATYWLEVANGTNTPLVLPEPSINTCNWHWAQAHFGPRGNRYAAVGHSPRIGFGVFPEFGTYTPMSGRWTDLAFCLNGPSGPVNFTAPPAPVAACCDCAGGCVDGKTLEDCVADGGVWQYPLTCSDAGVCPTQPGDDCASGVIQANDGLYGFDTTCGTVDTPSPNPELLGSELWFCYTVTTTGELVASMCPSTPALGGIDGTLSIYHDFDNPTVCPCPSEAGAAFFFDEVGENCSGLNDGGSGIRAEMQVFPGEKFLISVGQQGAQAAGGRGFLELFSPLACGLASPPVQEALDSGGPPSSKNRFLSITSGDAGAQQKIRVIAENLPAPFDTWNGTALYLTEPFQVCENSAQGLEVAPPNCAAAPGLPQKWFWAARLTCDRFNAHFEDWTELSQYCTGSGESCASDLDCVTGTCGVDGVIHIVDPAIVPSRKNLVNATVAESLYAVQAQDISAPSGTCLSKPVTRIVQSLWGDIAGVPGDCPVAVPDGSAALIGDVTEAIRKFSNLECALKKTRVDVHPALVNFKVDISDVLMLLGAFSGDPYPFAPGDPCAF